MSFLKYEPSNSTFSMTSYAASTAVPKLGAIPVAASTRPPLETNVPSSEITVPA